MGITTTNVRAALNNITTGNLADDTITYFIQKGEKNATGLTDTDDYVVAYAAYHGFLRSKVYDAYKTGDLSVKKNWEPLINELKKELDAEETKLFGSVGVVSSLMHDNRPDDPYETGDISYGDYE